MNKEQFLQELEKLLGDVTEQEREAALTYYREYFEDAGVENEYQVIKELGSPRRIADIILADAELRKKEVSPIVENNNQQNQNSQHTGFQSNNFTGYTPEPPKKSKTPWIVLGCVLGGVALVVIVYVIIIGSVAGGIFSYVNNHTVSEKEAACYEWSIPLEAENQFSKIEAEIGFGEIKIYQGNYAQVDVVAEAVTESFEVYVKGGVLYVQDKDDSIAFFNDEAEITVYLPTATYEKFELELGAGTGYVEDICANEMVIDVGAGEVETKGLNVLNKLELKIGAGEATLENLSAKDFTIDCGVGEAEIIGNLTGDGDIDCGVGSVSVDLTGAITAYDYDVTCDLGEISIGTEEITNGSRTINNNGSNSIKIDCGVGEVTIK